MDRLCITGGRQLSGTVQVAGAKNAALPIMAASILASQPVRLKAVPALADVEALSLVLDGLGVAVSRSASGDMSLETVDETPAVADGQLVRRTRASFCVLGPLLARRGKAIVSLPGGCSIGARPVDLHLRGLAALGADIETKDGHVIATSRGLRGATVDLRGPRGPTVTGTANVLCAATLARGVTTIVGAAREPEIVALGQFLVALGADIEGLGTETVEVRGVDSLGGAHHTIIPDRIEAATLLVAAAITQSSVTVDNVVPQHLSAVLQVLEAAGAEIECDADWVQLHMRAAPRPLRVAALPYPGVPTDLQAQITALLCTATGRSVVRDGVFPERFLHVLELRRMGVRIERFGSRIEINGPTRLQGATLKASDLRASAALVIAGLAAAGETVIHGVHHLDRGYEHLETKLASLGASIVRERYALPAVASA